VLKSFSNSFLLVVTALLRVVDSVDLLDNATSALLAGPRPSSNLTVGYRAVLHTFSTVSLRVGPSRRSPGPRFRGRVTPSRVG
jgi:hypothetical protein